MGERRDGSSDRRVSRRGGRRETDPARDEVDARRRRWEELDGAGAASPTEEPLSDGEIVTEPPQLGHLRGSSFPPRK